MHIPHVSGSPNNPPSRGLVLQLLSPSQNNVLFSSPSSSWISLVVIVVILVSQASHKIDTLSRVIVFKSFRPFLSVRKYESRKKEEHDQINKSFNNPLQSYKIVHKLSSNTWILSYLKILFSTRNTLIFIIILIELKYQYIT